jgi:hypothetical protein
MNARRNLALIVSVDASPIIRRQRPSFGPGRLLPIVARYPEIERLAHLSLMLG